MSARRPEVPSERRRSDESVLAGRPELDGAEPSPPGRLSFGPFVLDPETGRLHEGQRVIPLAPKPFETLLYLAERPGRLVSKTELMERLWPGTFVTDDALVQCVVEIRRALHDQVKTPRYVQTMPLRGYQFLNPVTRLEAKPTSSFPPREGVPAAPPEGPRAGAARSGGSWRPRRVLLGMGLVAAGALALLLGVEWFRGSARQDPAEPGSLVVMPILVEEPNAQSGWLRQGIADMVRSELGQTPGLHVVARHRLAAALAEAGYKDDAGPTEGTAAVLARRLRAEKLVTGSFVRVDDRFVLTAQVVDVATGRTEGTAAVRGNHPGDLLDAVDELCLKLLHDLRPAPAPSGSPSWRPARLATRSVEASRKYFEALVLFARGGRHGAEDAEARLDEALRLDPAFAQAYVKKAEIQQWRRQWGYGTPDPTPAVLAAARLVKDLPDRERLLVESFEALIVRHQTDAALRDWNALLQFYPTYGQEVGVPGLVADTFLHAGRWDDLIMVGEAHVDSSSLPDPERARLSSLLAQAFRRKGEFDRALLHAKRAVRLWPSQDGPRFLHERTELGRICLEAGRRAEAIAEFRAIAGDKEADALNLTDAAWGFYMAGEPLEASSLVERALAMDPLHGNAYHLRGWLALARGDYAAAVKNLEAAFERTPPAFGYAHKGDVGGDLAALYYAGVASQKLGDNGHATTDFERLTKLCSQLQRRHHDEDAANWQVASFLARADARLGRPAPEPPRLQGDDSTYFVQSARLHAVEGKREQALRELAQGLGLGHGEYRHIYDDPDFESLRVVAEFKRLVTDHVPHS